MIIADENYNPSISDRSFNYGDGCFTTILVLNFTAQLLPEHLQRLKLACHKLNIKNISWLEVENNLVEKAALTQNHVLKVHISRGKGGRGYDGSDANSPIVSFSSHTLPQHYLDWRRKGINVGVAQLKLSIQPALARIKHNNRLEQVLLKSELCNLESKLDDLLVCDLDSKLVEATASNVFWFDNGMWYTPSLDLCGVEGVMRNHILHFLAQNRLKFSIVRSEISLLADATSVFLCNAILGIIPVNTCAVTERTWRYANKETKLLMDALGF